MELKALLLILTVLAAVLMQQVEAENESRQTTADSKNEIYKRSLWEQLFKLLYRDYENKPWNHNTEDGGNRRLNNNAHNSNEEEHKNVKSDVKKANPNDKHKRRIYYDMVSLLTPFFATKELEVSEEVLNKSKEDDKKIKTKVNEPRKVNNQKNGRQANDAEAVKTLRSISKGDGTSKHFLLSLLEDFDTIPKALKMEAKLELLAVIKRYSQLQRNVTTHQESPRIAKPNHEEHNIRLEDLPSQLSEQSILADFFS